jgi:hypothetical protein
MTVVGQAGSQEMQQRLRKFHSLHPDADVIAVLKARLLDPIKPQNQNGRPRPHPLILLLGMIAMTAVSAFLYFSYFQR